MVSYTALVTSCDRHDLLRETLTTFAATADSSPIETIIVEDSALPEPSWLREISGLGRITWVSNGKRVGQLWSTDRLWSLCSTEYAFWIEDDWKFTERYYINRSYEILRDNPDILTVALRGNEWCHPSIKDPNGRIFTIAEPGWCGGWGGFMFNPGLRRKSDYERIGTYGQHGSYTQHSFDNELNLSKIYLGLGYRIATLPQRHCTHIGGGRSRAVEQLSSVGAGLPKLLIAVPACHVKYYGQWESGKNGWPYLDGIHVSGAAPAGVQAVRDTWARDCKAYENIDFKFFYGQPQATIENPAAQVGAPRPDEVYLDVLDDYEHLPHKTQAICRWALNRDYDYVFKCDDDTAVYVARLVQELAGRPFEYAGYVNTINKCSGGPGYFLSKRAIRLVSNSGGPDTWAEDMWVGEVLGRVNIYPQHLAGHIPGFEKHWYWPEGFDPTKLTKHTVAVHAVQPDMMRTWFEHKSLQETL